MLAIKMFNTKFEKAVEAPVRGVTICNSFGGCPRKSGGSLVVFSAAINTFNNFPKHDAVMCCTGPASGRRMVCRLLIWPGYRPLLFVIVTASGPLHELPRQPLGVHVGTRCGWGPPHMCQCKFLTSSCQCAKRVFGHLACNR